MSGLSLADMRRIGAQRNADIEQQKPAKPSLLSRLPFGGGEVKPAKKELPNEASSPAARIGVFGRPASEAAVAAPEASQPIVARTPAPTLTQKHASRPLSSNMLRHVGAAGAAGAIVGVGATGNPLALPAGAVVGALAGSIIGKRAQASAADHTKSIELKRKDAPHLFSTLEAACALLRFETPTLKIHVDPSAVFVAQMEASSRLSAAKTYRVDIGLLLLAGLSYHHIQALAAHALLDASARAEGNGVQAQTVAQLTALESNLSQRTGLLRLAKLDQLQAHTRDAAQAWQTGHSDRMHSADSLAARYAGPSAMVEALLAQGLLAATLLKDQAAGHSFAQTLESVRMGLSRPDLDNALRLVADMQYPSAEDAQRGMPIALIERFAQLDTNCAIPVLPSPEPVFMFLPPATQKRLEKQIAPANKKKKADAPATAKAAGKVKNEKPKKAKKAKGYKLAARANASSTQSLFGRLLGGKAPKALPAQEMVSQPLYEADALFKEDQAIGLEAYQSLVAEHPRWGLAKLRLAEAQIEMGIADGVGSLMACAETLPSALPTILDRLQSALAMVSPLDQEPLRHAIDTMLANADRTAQERAEIDLGMLSEASMDVQDRGTMKALFEATPGLREAWVFGAPCAWMPEVPQHAVIGLAPRLGGEDAQAMALSIAEHAAIAGTVAVHIETGTPSGALGDALASKPSLWRREAR